MPRPLAAPGHMGVDYEQRVDFARLRDYRVGRAKASLEASDCGAFLLFDFYNIRYTTQTWIGGALGDKMIRYALLARGREEGLSAAIALGGIGRGEALLKLGGLQEAELALEAVLGPVSAGPGRNPRFAMFAHRALGRVAVQARRFEAADRHLEAALAIASAPDQDNRIEQAHTWRAIGNRRRAAQQQHVGPAARAALGRRVAGGDGFGTAMLLAAPTPGGIDE